VEPSPSVAAATADSEVVELIVRRCRRRARRERRAWV
jgi:hypothetical protein